MIGRAMSSSPTADAPAPPSPGRSTRFDFRHRLFQVPAARFRRSPAGEPLFYVRLGELDCALAIPGIRLEFGIASDSHDGKLRSMVEGGLRYVREIRPGDSIPRELLDGSCSWSLDEQHLERARNRLSVQLAYWVIGADARIASVQQLNEAAQDPEIKARVTEAVDEAAERLGLGRERRQDVLARLELVARELAYIEAMRDRYGCVRMVLANLRKANDLYRHDRGIQEEISRTQLLMSEPDAALRELFAEVDGQTGEVITVLRNVPSMVEFIRHNRDEIHFRLMVWDDIVADHQGTPVTAGDALERLILKTHRFAAQNFPKVSRWGLQSRA